MKLRNSLVCILVGLHFSGCATMSGSLLSGVGAGAALGTAAGVGFSNDKGDGAWKGALIGSALGLAGSYFIHNSLEKRDADIRRETLLNLERFGVEGIPNQSQMYPDPFNFDRADPQSTIDAHKKRRSR